MGLRVLAVFPRCCDLVSSEGPDPQRVIGLVTPEIGDGPLNIVVNVGVWIPEAAEPGMEAQADAQHVKVGRLTIDLSEAEIWEPRPDWSTLRPNRGTIRARLPALHASCLERAPAGSLLPLLEEGSRGDPPRETVLSASRSAAKALEAGWAGDPVRLHEGVTRLAGLGGGLTPSGDDFLCGAMLWAWVAHPTPGSFCRVIVEIAAPRTTRLSAAFLAAAARGECSAGWHALLDALAQGDDVGVAAAARVVLARGATSGADALAGFVWAGAILGFG